MNLNTEQLKKMSNAVRALAMDAVQAANSGHPGMPMGMADVATVLYSKFMKFDAAAPVWPNRDRFILSAGHGSMLLYAINYLCGYEKISLDEIKNFRQLKSLTDGHPEYYPGAGIEMTTGPLGQGISHAVGFALAERVLNKMHDGKYIDHYTYVIASDGDLMEGISHEACSFAGTQKLSKLIVLYDDNGITIDGKTDLSFTEDVGKRFDAYGWAVQKVDGHDHAAIEAAIAEAQKSDKPSLICCKTKIGFGAPTKEGKSSSHGSPLGAEEIEGARKNLDWDAPAFEIPEDILNLWRGVGSAHSAECKAWYSQDNIQNFEIAISADVSDIVDDAIANAKAEFLKNKPSVATRKASGMVLEHLVPELPILIGGSADLTGSNNTKTSHHDKFICPETGYDGQYINYGVREHGMAAVMNGMALHGGIVPYGGTFLCFADYCRPSIRLAALMETRSIYVMTHDSIGLGEDGPTHQPIEHLASLRAMPNVHLFRPCDGIETAEAWQLALNNQHGPSVIVLTRQNLPTLRSEADAAENLSAKGAYILRTASSVPKAVLYASGSEVEIAVGAAEKLEAEGIPTQVVSVPCFETFHKQDDAYKANIYVDSAPAHVAIEAACKMGWEEFIGRKGKFVGMKGFGASGPAEELYVHFGITVDATVKAVKDQL
ncbi:MAG: transketolase [Alphaproteobacteria bacterium]|nr:transketolase [Alphaproteobacteria bacterium]